MPFENLIEVVGIDLDELAVLEARQRLFRLAREVAENAHHEGQFLHFDRVADLHVVGDVDARRPNPIELMLCAFFCHL